jgi:8-oxo-dGTP pyrophosphatase MutT (NUDIX family)
MERGMAISNRDVSIVLAGYLERHPEEAALLSEPLSLLSREDDCISRRSFPMHVTAGALLVRGTEVLLVEHRAYGILLQPGGHVESADDATLPGAARRELLEETGIDPGAVVCFSDDPVYVEYGRVPARPGKGEPVHWHLDVGYAFTTVDGDIGRIQKSEVTGAGWYPLDVAERRVGSRVGRVADMHGLRALLGHVATLK